MKNKMKLFLPIFILLFSLCNNSFATTFDNMLMHHPSTSQSFMGEHKNIKWVLHTPTLTPDLAQPEKDEADYRGQVDVGKIDLDGDGKDETIKAIWNGGVTDHFLTIEVYKNDKLISTLKSEFGIQSNYKIENIDGDGKKEIIIWSGLWDSRQPGEDGVTESTFEGHSAPHRYVVATYKLIRGEYLLWDIYTTKNKYEPFSDQQPKE